MIYYNSSAWIKVVNGYVNEFQGEKQLTSGKFGSLEKVECGSETPSSTPSEAPVETSTDETDEPAKELLEETTEDGEKNEAFTEDTPETTDF